MALQADPTTRQALDTTAPVLDVRGLRTSFFTRRGEVHAVRDVSFAVHHGETFALVGESGSGKTATAMSILRMLPASGEIRDGKIIFNGENLLDRTEHQMERIRGRQIGLIPQDPSASLNPLMTVGDHITELLGVHMRLRGRAARDRTIELLEAVGIPEPANRFKAYPHQLSGGMRQRVMIALAIACRPALLIADEPTTALDSTVQAQILELIATLARDMNTATILITHNLGIVAGIAGRVAVMYAGRVVEVAGRHELFDDPHHPYTVGLLDCVPRVDRITPGTFQTIAGQPPDLLRVEPGCSFAPRCGFVSDQCLTDLPMLVPDMAAHRAACWNQAQVLARAVDAETSTIVGPGARAVAEAGPITDAGASTGPAATVPGLVNSG
jgi:oligopeptide/dipeptide ABC transporter ATP-binding protein